MKTTLAVFLAVAFVGCAHTKVTPTAKAPVAKAPPAAAPAETDPKQYQSPPPQEEPRVRLTITQTFPQGWMVLRTQDGTRVRLINPKRKAAINAQIVPTQAVDVPAIIQNVKNEMAGVKGKVKVKSSPGLTEITVTFPQQGVTVAGKLVLKDFEGTPATAVVIGTWPKKYDRAVTKAFDAYWKSIQVKAEPVAPPPTK